MAKKKVLKEQIDNLKSLLESQKKINRALKEVQFSEKIQSVIDTLKELGHLEYQFETQSSTGCSVSDSKKLTLVLHYTDY
jgi:hypothetical protein